MPTVGASQASHVYYLTIVEDHSRGRRLLWVCGLCMDPLSTQLCDFTIPFISLMELGNV